MDFIQKFANNEALLSVSGFALWKCISALWIRQTVKQRFEYAGKVSDITIYPMKAAAGIQLQSVKCTTLGFESEGLRDRVFMAIRKIGETGEFMDDLIQPKLVLIKLRRVGHNICLDAPGMPTLALPGDLNTKGDIIKCQVNRSKNVLTVDCGPEASDWINKYLNKEDARLVHYSPKITYRSPWEIPRDNASGIHMNDMVAFSCVTPYMVCSQRSLDDLNTKLEKPVTMTTFRPNIVIDGPEPFDEDNWEYIKIGENVILRSAEPRIICGVVNIDPKTAERNKDFEPRKTLEKYRMIPGYTKSGAFGLRTGIDVEGDIKIGDPVYVIRK